MESLVDIANETAAQRVLSCRHVARLTLCQFVSLFVTPTVRQHVRSSLRRRRQLLLLLLPPRPLSLHPNAWHAIDRWACNSIWKTVAHAAYYSSSNWSHCCRHDWAAPRIRLSVRSAHRCWSCAPRPDDMAAVMHLPAAAYALAVLPPCI